MRDDDTLEAFVKKAAIGVWHASCTCRMGADGDPMAVTDTQGRVRGIDGLRDTIHHTREERTHFDALIALGLHDSFRLFEQPPKAFSWWDYRMLGFQKNRGLRIDHILVSDALRGEVQACEIDRAPRKREKPSDHAPVIATLAD